MTLTDADRALADLRLDADAAGTAVTGEGFRSPTTLPVLFRAA
ncbi:MAG: hypothetical protein ACRDWD_05295 [Acidimicrobiia bacterium]